MSKKSAVGGIFAALAVIAVATILPDLIRYIKIRSM